MNGNRFRPARPIAALVGVVWLLLGSMLIAADFPSGDAHPTPRPLSAQAPANSPSARWEKEIQAYEGADKKQPPPEGAVLFTGASGIRMWQSLAKDFPDQKVINRGFGGSEMADSAYFAERIVIPYKPRLIVIQAGGNDINILKSFTPVVGLTLRNRNHIAGRSI
jgi:hypothetical protein